MSWKCTHRLISSILKGRNEDGGSRICCICKINDTPRGRKNTRKKVNRLSTILFFALDLVILVFVMNSRKRISKALGNSIGA